MNKRELLAEIMRQIREHSSTRERDKERQRATQTLATRWKHSRCNTRPRNTLVTPAGNAEGAGKGSQINWSRRKG